MVGRLNRLWSDILIRGDIGHPPLRGQLVGRTLSIYGNGRQLLAVVELTPPEFDIKIFERLSSVQLRQMTKGVDCLARQLHTKGEFDYLVVRHNGLKVER